MESPQKISYNYKKIYNINDKIHTEYFSFYFNLIKDISKGDKYSFKLNNKLPQKLGLGTSIYFDSKNNSLWIGSNGTGLIEYKIH